MKNEETDMLAVTGITGHTGGFFLRELQAGNYRGHIRCLVRSAEKAQYLTDSGLDVELVEGDLHDEESIRRLLRGASAVVHIANIGFSPSILRIGKACGVKRFVLVHTTGIYSRYKSAAQGYIDVENAILPQMKELQVTILRPTMIFGDMRDYNISRFIRFVDKLPVLPTVGNGNARIQPVNARDLGCALYQVLLTERTCGKAYDLSGETALSIRQLYRLIAEQLGKKRIIVGIPMNLCLFGAKCIRWATSGKADMVEKVLRMGENRDYSHEEAVKDFGYAPEPFVLGLQREVAEYLAGKKNRG